MFQVCMPINVSNHMSLISYNYLVCSCKTYFKYVLSVSEEN